jgi:hypothetical protein
MYNLGMNLLVRPIVRWHERRGEVRGEVRGRLSERQLWLDWNQRRMDAEARGEGFSEPPPIVEMEEAE